MLPAIAWDQPPPAFASAVADLARVHARGQYHGGITGRSGTLTPYAAPECFFASGETSPAADVYALAVVLWEELADEVAWAGAAEEQIEAAVRTGRRPDLLAIGDTDGVVELLSACWAQDPADRPTVRAIAAATGAAPASEDDGHPSALVVDLGSDSVHAGFAGDDAPWVAIPCCTASGQRPLRHGRVRPGGWTAMRAVWTRVFAELKVSPTTFPVLVSEAPMAPPEQRQRMAEMLYELGVPAVAFENAGRLALYASGRGTGVVVQVGDYLSTTVVYEGFTFPQAEQWRPFGGRDLTDHLCRLLCGDGLQMLDPQHTDTVAAIKEEHCYVAEDYDAERDRAECTTELMTDVELPDGTTVVIDQSRFEVAEPMFQKPVDLPGFVCDALVRCDRDARRDMYYNIILSGGASLMRGFPERLRRELAERLPSTMRIKVVDPPERKFSVWIGGSILASLSTFSGFWVRPDSPPGRLHRTSYCEMVPPILPDPPAPESMQDDAEGEPVVIAMGSTFVCAGFGGDDAPRCVIPTLIGDGSRYPAPMVGMQTARPPYVGDEADAKRGAISLRWPLRADMSADITDDLLTILFHVLYNHLRVNPAQHRMIIVGGDSRLASAAAAFHPLSLRFFDPDLMSLVSQGHETGIVVHLGGRALRVTAIQKCFVLCRVEAPLGGHALTRFMQRLLLRLGVDLTATSAGFRLAEDIKSRLCRVRARGADAHADTDAATYELPDGETVELRAERHLCPEALFDPALLGLECPGLPAVIAECLSRATECLCNAGYEGSTEDLCASVFLTGRGAKFPGIAKRVQAELVASMGDRKMRVVPVTECGFTRWIGGSIMSTLSEAAQPGQPGLEQPVELGVEEIVALPLLDPAPDLPPKTKKEPTPVVLDLGSHRALAGLADGKPVSVPSVLGRMRPSLRIGMVGLDFRDRFVGDEAIAKRGVLDLTSPIVRGAVVNADDVEVLLHHLFYNELRIETEEHPVLLVDSPLVSEKSRTSLFLALDETFAVPSVTFVPAAPAALLAADKDSGIVLDVGHGSMVCTPVAPGRRVVSGAVERTNVGSGDMERLLVAAHPQLQTDSGTTTAREAKEAVCCCIPTSEEAVFELPSGDVLRVPGEARGEAAEVVFDPRVIGLESLGAADLVRQVQRTSSIEGPVFVTGAGSLVRGFVERLQRELDAPVARLPPDAAWMGAARMHK